MNNAMSTKEVVESFNSDGEPEFFRAFSSRLKEFLLAFPPKDGYRMVVHTSDMLSSMPGLANLYRSAIESGKKPVDLGLPDLSRFATQVVFRAELLDKDGQIVSSASSFCEVEFPDKTWETMETNARSRLMASLGIGYELLDVDEKRQQQQSGKKPTNAPQFTMVPAIKTGGTEKVSAALKTVESSPPETVEAVDTTRPPASPETVKTEPDSAETQAEETSVINSSEFLFAENATETIPEAVLRQIKTLSLNKGMHVNPVTTKEEARVERKRLMLA